MSYPFPWSLFPEELDILPTSFADTHQWVIENMTYFDTQWIECAYPISGSYSPTPRYIYYAFILIALFGRKSTWLTNAALGLVMTFSSTAAFHGIILAIIRRNLAPEYLFENSNWEIVQVDGPYFANHITDGWLYNVTTNETWLPVLPMAWDNDGDAILVIVGAAFIVLLPMQIWSSTLREAGGLKILVGIWSCLLLAGLISALIYVEYVLVWTFPQLRFCPPGAADKLPFSNRGLYEYPLEWTPGDWYRWNRIVGEQYVYRNATVRFPDICLYPCLQFEWLLRDPEDIYVYEINTAGGYKNPKLWVFATIYFLVASSCVCNICTLLVTHTNLFTHEKWGLDHKLVQHIQDREFAALWKKAYEKRNLKTSLFQRVVAIFFWYISLVGIIMSPITLLAFVVVVELLLLRFDPGAETFRHVGQWGALISAMLVLLSAFGSWLFELDESRIQEVFMAC